MIQSSPFLRRALLADTIFSGAGAMSFTLGAAILANLTELPETLSRENRPGSDSLYGAGWLACDAIGHAESMDSARHRD
jgi:hypothetical protein